MKITKCPKGHFYPSDRYSVCPYCDGEISLNTYYHPDSPPSCETANTPVQPVIPRQMAVPPVRPVTPLHPAVPPVSPVMPLQTAIPPRPVPSSFYKAEPEVLTPEEEEGRDILSKINGYTGSEPFIFICYSHKDAKKLSVILPILEANNVRFWFDSWIKSGADYIDEIADRIEKCSQFFVFTSENLNGSDFAKNEIFMATERFKEIVRVDLDGADLCSGLFLQIGRKQAILRKRYSEQEYHEKILAAITQKAFGRAPSEAEGIKTAVAQDYEVERELAKGGNSTVYLAVSKKTGGLVAIKRGHIDGSYLGSRTGLFFERERNILARNYSPFVPQLFDYYEDGDGICLAETYIPGQSLDEIVYWSTAELIGRMIEVAKILDEFHQHGIVHCDVKPANIRLYKDRIYLIDFGAAIDMNAADRGAVCCGTLGYAAPELFGGYNGEADVYGVVSLPSPEAQSGVDPRADVFSLGRTIQRMLEKINHCPGGNRSVSVEATTVLFNSTAIENSDYYRSDPILDAIINKMTMEQRSKRYDSMREVITALTDYLTIRELKDKKAR